MDWRRLFRIAPLVAVLVLLAQPCPAARQRILLVQSYEPSLPWTAQCERGIRSALPESVDLDIVYLDTKRRPQSEYQRTVDETLARFRRTAPDLVMLGDDNALRLLGPPIAETDTPVVYFGINNNPRAYFETLPHNVVGVLERIPLFHWIRWLTRVVPQSRKILVLMDYSPTAQAIFDSSFKGRATVFYDGRQIDCELIGEWAKWQEAVETNDSDFIVMPIYHALRDANGEYVDYYTVATWTSAHSRVPIFTVQDYTVGADGAAGALVVVGEEHGAIAGRLARRILEGDNVEGLSAADGQEGQLFFNRKQLRRFGLSLPSDLAQKAIFK